MEITDHQAKSFAHQLTRRFPSGSEARLAGVGTTGVAAHKMGRRWIMIEMGEHAHTHIIRGNADRFANLTVSRRF